LQEKHMAGSLLRRLYLKIWIVILPVRKADKFCQEITPENRV
jgi:hypothetical protein